MGIRQQTIDDYGAFVEKFNPKKTTDDCYTPPQVYEAVRDWACGEYGIDPSKVVRPYYPQSLRKGNAAKEKMPGTQIHHVVSIKYLNTAQCHPSIQD